MQEFEHGRGNRIGLLRDYPGVSLRGPFNRPARQEAGFVEAGLGRLLSLAAAG